MRLSTASACEVVEASSADAVDGVVPRFVARPTDAEQLQGLLADAHGRGLRVVARGMGTRLHWGAAPEAVDLVVDTSRMSRVLAHAAGDLVVTVQAGLPLADLQAALAPHGQRLALDGAQGSIGGAIATAPSGPLRYRYGSVRDLIIGITVVLADGTVAKAGGTVVKNVAGYDLAKLYTGSLGTLGVVTEATFRLHPLPETRRYVTMTCSDPGRAAAGVAAVRNSQNDPVAIEVDRPEAGGPITVGVAVEGVAAGIGARAGDVAALLGTGAAIHEDPPDWWAVAPHGRLGPAAVLTAEPTGLEAVLTRAPGVLRGSAGVGVFSVGLEASPLGDGLASALDALRTLAAEHAGTAVLRCAPPEAKDGLDVWGPVSGLALMRRVKDEFDPEHRLASGRFVGGI